MSKLELKDIVGYLPYDLQIKCIDDDGSISYGTWITIDNHSNIGVACGMHMAYGRCEDENIFPILHPMSDLAKPIVVNDKEFIPMIKIAEILNLDGYYGIYTSVNTVKDFIEISIWGEHILTIDCKLNILMKSEKYMTIITFEMYNQILDLLNQWHFDYRDLIGQGLAIDINKLKKEEKK